MVKDRPDYKSRDNKYDKIRHLVEVDDDILAVFLINSMDLPDLKELYIAKNANIDKNYIDSLIHVLGINQAIDIEKPQEHVIGQEGEEEEEEVIENDNNLLGKIKWKVTEYERIRILKIYEFDKTIFVLINSNTQLQHTVDNILGYYYDLDEIPKSLF